MLSLQYGVMVMKETNILVYVYMLNRMVSHEDNVLENKL